jgi:peroxiredoxin
MAKHFVGILLGVVGGLMVEGALRATEPLALDRGIGQQVANFTLNDSTGDPVPLYRFRGKCAVVLAFLGTDCPVSNVYVPRLVEFNKRYKDKGVVFLGVNANAHETVEQIAAHAKEYGIDFPVLKDPVNLVADLTLAERTCEVLVIDGQARLRYRGAIDDQYGQGTRKPAPTKNYLAAALDAVLAGKPVEIAATPVVGCLLDRVEVKAKPLIASNLPRVRPAPRVIVEALNEKEKDAAVTVGKVTYTGDVAAIMQNKCQSCHRPGQVGPFSLLSYDDARRHAAMIREVVDERRMPPWHADPRYGQFGNDRSLTARERAVLLAWVDQGAPLGDPADMPPPKTFPEGWTIGKPDRIFEIPEPYTVPAQGVLDYVEIHVPTHFTEDMWVQAAEAQPGDRAVVHHIILFIDDHKMERRRGEGHLCAFAPGDLPSVYPPGIAKKIPPGSDLVFQIHYAPNGKVRTDRSRLGLIFAKAPVAHEAHTHAVAQNLFIIPPGADNYPVKSSFTFARDSHLLSFMPHMHLRGKSFEYKATYPDGKSEILLSVPAYDFGWQSFYELSEPKAMPKGTRIECLAHYDNSSGNPANPDPTKAITWGKQTFDEMMIGYIAFYADSPNTAEAEPQKPAALKLASSAAQLFRALLGPNPTLVSPRAK